MPFSVIGGERESLTLVAEDYKKAVQAYLEQLGFTLHKDSFVHGTSPDQIYTNPSIDPDKNYHLEVKATKVSITEKKFALQYMDRLVAYLNASNDSKFVFLIFAQEVTNHQKWKKFFGEFFSREEILSWIDKYKSLLPEDRQEIIEKSNDKEILKFFETTHVTVALGRNLEVATEALKHRSTLSPYNKARKLLNESIRRELPVKNESVLSTNLVEIIFTGKLYRGYVQIKKRSDVYKNLGNEWYPPFILKDNNIYCLYPLNSKNPLCRFIEGDIVEDDLLDFASNDIESRDSCIYLLNENIKRLVWQKGVRRVSKKSLYYFPAEKNNDRFEKVFKKKADQTDREVVTPYYISDLPKLKEDGEIDDSAEDEPDEENTEGNGDEKTESKENSENPDSDLYCLYHKAITMRVRFYWDNFYIQIMPRKAFSKNGRWILTGKLGKYFEEKFRNPKYNRNSHVRAEVNFFYYHIFENEDNYLVKEPQFSDFKFKQLVLPFDWISKSRDINVRSLLEHY
ncbi:MAG: hypothetical protein ACFFD4_23040 [Candidatus Odinarchaeota archaeon]